MDAELRQIVELQGQQNQLLAKQLQWFKFGLLTLAVLVAVSTCCLAYLIRERGASASYISPLISESLVEPAGSLAENDAVQFAVRIPAPEMVKPESITPIDFQFPTRDSDEFVPARGCHGMCF